MRRYNAPWARLLKMLTGLGSCILLGVGILIGANAHEPALRYMAVTGAILGIASGALFMVRGYEVREGSLLIHRPLWITTFSLADLNQVTHDPAALGSSLRLFGNGGFFSFTGWFRSKSLGVYRLFGTDPERAVVLKFGHQRTVVVTPDHPEEFVEELRGLINPG